jgi:UDP-N-acetylglucosamine 2-epimerase (non-hydrolysing)
MGIHLSKNIFLLPPLSFTESLYLWKDSRVVLTDSGGLQEETTALGVPCVTIRENTERPITVEIGTNVLAGTRKENILWACGQSIEKTKTARVPDLWDGKARSGYGGDWGMNLSPIGFDAVIRLVIWGSRSGMKWLDALDSL